MLIFRPFAKYAVFSGRATRPEYWWFQLFQLIMVLCLFGLFLSGLTGGLERGIVTGMATLVLFAFFVLACLLPNLAVCVRRLHDSNRSAWWLLLWLPGVLTQITGASLPGLGLHSTSMLADLASTTLLGWAGRACSLAMLGLMALPGTLGPNRFGPDPRGDARDVAQVFDADEPDDIPASVIGEPALRAPPTVSPAPAAKTPYTRPPQPAPPPFSTSRPSFGKRR